MSIRSAGHKAAKAFKEQLKRKLKQTAAASDVNADLQAATLVNADREDVESSLLGNPAEAQELERWDFAEQIKDRTVGGIQTFIDKTIKNDITPFFITTAARGLTLIDAVKSLPGVALDLAMLLAKLGPLRVNGWEIQRHTEMWGVIAKMLSFYSETTVHTQAPMITSNASAAHSTKSPMIHTRSDMKIDFAKDEIHRIANSFNLEADQLLMLLKTAAKIHANGKIELATLADVELSGATGLVTKAGTTTKNSSAISHTIAAGVSVTISAPMVNINPLVPTTPDIPTVVLPILPITFDGKIASGKTMPQYKGQNGSGVIII